MLLSVQEAVLCARTGTENGVCQPSVSNLPGYSKTLFGCSLKGRYMTVLATNAQSTLNLCLVTAFLQGADPSSLCPPPLPVLPIAQSVCPLHAAIMLDLAVLIVCWKWHSCDPLTASK